jgi:NAD(P)-dependent dehydrogenase (short-subunit alcohol dehydrogenase family)
MTNVKITALIIGVSSDIGLALARHWASSGINVIGSYRTMSDDLLLSESIFERLAYCDFTNKDSISSFIKNITSLDFKWDVLVVCPGTMNPIGPFSNCNIDEWERGIAVNLVAPLRILHGLLGNRNKSKLLPLVIFFAGGGVNSAPVNYSSYTTSKIGLIKAVELLDAEFEDVRFSIIGPGWVQTKIHQETLIAQVRANDAAEETKRRMDASDFNPMNKVIECVDWLLYAQKKIIGGRNFSVVNDNWGDPSLELSLQTDPNRYKLRRFGNT